MATRLYLVELRSGKNRKKLIEATSQEAAIRTATAPLVLSCTIPTPLEAMKLQANGEAEVISPSMPPLVPEKAPEEKPQEKPPGEEKPPVENAPEQTAQAHQEA